MKEEIPAPVKPVGRPEFRQIEEMPEFSGKEGKLESGLTGGMKDYGIKEAATGTGTLIAGELIPEIAAVI